MQFKAQKLKKLTKMTKRTLFWILGTSLRIRSWLYSFQTCVLTRRTFWYADHANPSSGSEDLEHTNSWRTDIQTDISGFWHFEPLSRSPMLTNLVSLESLFSGRHFESRSFFILITKNRVNHQNTQKGVEIIQTKTITRTRSELKTSKSLLKSAKTTTWILI